MLRLSLKTLLAVLLLCATAFASDPREDARGLVNLVDGVVAAIDSANRADARSRWDGFNETWLHVEDGVRALDLGSYRRIEERMQDVTGALPLSGEWAPADAKRSLGELRTECLAVAAMPARASAPVEHGSIDAYLRVLDAARPEADPEGAFGAARDGWYRVEGRVSIADTSAYTACESALADARRAAAKKDGPGVAHALARVRERVAPLASAGGHMGSIDVAAILLREGAEALIVLAAIAAFLGRIGAASRARIVWAGGAIGLVASLAGGALLVWFFAGVTAGERREVVEGVSSLVAAGLLIFVGQWLHEKIRRGGWKTQVQSAVEGGRTLSLLLVAFFAVFREGAETVVFLAGMAPASTPHEMLTGVGIGLGALALLAVVILGLGKRLPLGPFLSFATLLLWALAVKFVGGGIHALQAGGLVSATRVGWLPELPSIGFGPTLEGAGAQAATILLWAAFTFGPRLSRPAANRPPRPELASPAKPA